MPITPETPEQKKAVDALIEFLITEFSPPNVVEAIANSLFIAREIAQDYEKPAPGWLEISKLPQWLYTARNPHHLFKVYKFFEDINAIDVAANEDSRGLQALIILSKFFSLSSNWAGNASVMGYAISSPSLVVQPTINHRILKFLITLSRQRCTGKVREALINDINQLTHESARSRFEAELNGAISKAQESLKTQAQIPFIIEQPLLCGTTAPDQSINAILPRINRKPRLSQG